MSHLTATGAKMKQLFIGVKENAPIIRKKLNDLKNIQAGAANLSFTCHVIVKLIAINKIFVTII